MKVSLIGPVYPYRGGIAAFSTELSYELAAAGVEVQTISFKQQYPRWLYPGQSDKDPSSFNIQVPALYTLDPFNFFSWSKTVRLVTEFAPGLVIFQWWTTFWAPSFYFISSALNKRNFPCVFCIHNVVPHEKRLADIWLSRKVLSQGKGYITLSPKENNRLERIFPSAKIFSARLPVSRLVPPAVEREKARKELGIDERKKVLLFFGIVRPYKGLSVLIDALGFLRKEGLSPILIIAGEFWEDINDYRKQIKQNGLTEQVIIINRYLPNEELPLLFSAADCFIAPYINGTQSAAIKTAMSFRLPILASDQISGDLDPMVYPFLSHKAGNAQDLANSIRIFFQQRPQEIYLPKERNDWAHLVNLIRQIGIQL